MASGLLGAALGVSGELLGSSWGRLGVSWGALAALWGALGASWDGLGPSWVGLGVVLDPLGRSRGAPGGLLGRSKIDQKIDPKPDPKSGRIATAKNGSNATPVVVSELDRTQPSSSWVVQKIYQFRYWSD